MTYSDELRLEQGCMMLMALERSSGRARTGGLLVDLTIDMGKTGQRTIQGSVVTVMRGISQT